MTFETVLIDRTGKDDDEDNEISFRFDRQNRLWPKSSRSRDRPRKSTATSKASAHLLVRVVEEELAQHDRRPPALLRAAAVLDARAQVQVVRGGVEQRRGLGAGRGLVLLERQLVVHAWGRNDRVSAAAMKRIDRLSGNLPDNQSPFERHKATVRMSCNQRHDEGNGFDRERNSWLGPDAPRW